MRVFGSNSSAQFRMLDPFYRKKKHDQMAQQAMEQCAEQCVEELFMEYDLFQGFDRYVSELHHVMFDHACTGLLGCLQTGSKRQQQLHPLPVIRGTCG